MPLEWTYALIGGILIGTAASLMLWLNGRVTGISGIIGGLFNQGEKAWRIYFLLGLLAGGIFLQLLNPTFFSGRLDIDPLTTLIAGCLVGFGTSLGSGCTSGHGVCGISRLSVRSIVATFAFIVMGVISVLIAKAYLW